MMTSCDPNLYLRNLSEVPIINGGINTNELILLQTELDINSKKHNPSKVHQYSEVLYSEYLIYLDHLVRRSVGERRAMYLLFNNGKYFKLFVE